METTTNIPLTASRKRLSRSQTILFALAVFALTIALFYAEENWRGKRAWVSYKQQLEQKGLLVDFAKLFPPELPAESNIFGSPMMLDFIKGGGEPIKPGKIGTKTLIHRPVKTTNSAVLIEPNTNDWVVAIINTRVADEQQLEPKESAATYTQEALSLVEKRTKRMLSGATGKLLVDAQTLQQEPLRITIGASASNGVPSREMLEKTFKRYSLRQNGDDSYSVVVASVLAAENHLVTTPSIDGELKELVQVLQRPYSRLPGDYSDPRSVPLPNFVKVRSTAQLLAEQAQCYLLLGQPEEALRRIEVIQRLRVLMDLRPSHEPAVLVTVMINTAISGLLVHVVHDGFRLEAWKEAQLLALPAIVREIELLPRVALSMRSELVFTVWALERHRLSEVFAFQEDNKWRNKLYDLIPKGWQYQNLLTYARCMETQITAVQEPLPLLDPERLNKASAQFEKDLEGFSPFLYVLKMAVPNTKKAIQTAGRNTTKLNQTAIVCALERYRIKNREYPENLRQLAPEFMEEVPRDVVGGDELKYTKTSADKFLLYSIGWNKKDDGGQSADSQEEGDWVWGGKW